jgi:DNA-binding MurR/RpiR family transcriptional regulator
VKSLLEQLREADLSPAERRIADVIVGQPETIAFGTVAEIAKAAGAGGATVMRLSAKLGFAGFSELQTAIQQELTTRLRPAAARIRQRADNDVLEHAINTELGNVQQTLSAVEPDVLQRAAALLRDSRMVGVLAGDSGIGVAHDLVIQLGMVRPNVFVAEVGSVAVVRSLAWLGAADVLIAIDSARYETAVVAAAERASDAGVPIVAFSDSHLSRIAKIATCSFRFVDEGAGPFDSYVGVLALANLLVAATVRAAGVDVVEHLDQLEATWRATSALGSE